MERVNFGSEIKRQILCLSIKSPCCKNSFITGTTVFAKSRKNEFTEPLAQYIEKLTSKKRRAFFDELENVGYYAEKNENGEKYPASGGRTCQYCHSMLMRGAFLVCGRASRNESELHLEMSMPNETAADIIKKSLLGALIEPKRATRRSEILLYYKKREAVSDFLSYIGAVTLSFELINDTILKETRAVANRQKNCDTTNIMKTLGAAERQTDAIMAIIEHGALNELPQPLRRTAQIRLENPIEPLDIITELHEGEITRSGVNHRLARIVKYAEKKGYILKRSSKQSQRQIKQREKK